MSQGLKAGMGLYRNQDQAFEKELAGQSAVRLLPIEMEFGLTPDGYFLAIRLSGVGVPKVETKATIQFEHQEAKNLRERISSANLLNWGNTIYICEHVDVADNADQFFIPSSVLAELRRSAIESFALQPLLVEETKPQQVYDLKIRKLPPSNTSILRNISVSLIYIMFPIVWHKHFTSNREQM